MIVEITIKYKIIIINIKTSIKIKIKGIIFMIMKIMNRLIIKVI